MPLISCIDSTTIQKTDLVCKFGTFLFTFSLFNFFLGGFFWYFWPPLYGYMRAQGPHMALGSQTYPSRWSKCKKELILICGSCFRTFGHPKKVILDVCYAVLTPSWGSKCPQGPHIDLYPYFHVLPLQPTKKQILFSYVVHFFSFSPFSWFFLPLFWLFLTPLYAYSCAQGPHMELIPQIYLFRWWKCKNRAHFSLLFSFWTWGPWKSRFGGLLCSFNPLLRPKVPQRSSYRLIPLFSCITSPTNKKKDLVCKFRSLFFIFSFSNFFRHLFLAVFDPPLCLHECPRSPYGP